MRANLFIITFLFSATFASGQVDEKVKEINKIVEGLSNEDTNYVVKTLNNDYFVKRNEVYDNGIELSGHFKNGDLKMIDCSVGLSYGMRRFVYFISENKLILVLEKEESYSKNDDSTGVLKNYQKINTVFEGRYYFDSSKIIHAKIIGKNSFEDYSKENKEKILLRNYKEFIAELKE